MTDLASFSFPPGGDSWSMLIPSRCRAVETGKDQRQNKKCIRNPRRGPPDEIERVATCNTATVHVCQTVITNGTKLLHGSNRSATDSALISRRVFIIMNIMIIIIIIIICVVIITPQTIVLSSGSDGTQI
jgi:hypothetical protein